MDKGNITFKNRLQELRWKNLPSTLPSSSRNQLWDCLPKQGPEQMLEWIVASVDTGFPWLCAEIEEIEVSWNDIKQLLISILNFGYKMLVKKRLFEHQIIRKYLLLTILNSVVCTCKICSFDIVMETEGRKCCKISICYIIWICCSHTDPLNTPWKNWYYLYFCWPVKKVLINVLIKKK